MISQIEYMNELHIKNHYVPKCYLKRWEDSSNKICVYKTLVNHSNVPLWKKYRTSAIAYHRHLYTQIVSGSESDKLEKRFDKEYESPASDALEKVVLEKRLSAGDWKNLIRFLAAQDVRTPLRLIEHLKRNKTFLPDTLPDIVQKRLKEKELNTFKEYKRPENNYDFPLKITREFNTDKGSGVLKAELCLGRGTWIYSINTLLELSEKILHKHKWTIVKPAKGYKWFTSDNPVIKLNYIDQNNYDLGGGWDIEKGNIIFLIGPYHAMFVQIGERALLKNSQLSVKQTKEFRKFMAENSYRMIFSNYYDEEIVEMKTRQVNSQKIKKEKLEWKNWNKLNSEMEREFLKSNRNS